MNKRELLFGFGAGLLIAASILGITAQKETTAAELLTKEQLENAAEQLQLVVLSKAELEQLKQDKKVELQPLPTPPKQPAAPVSPSPEQPKTKQPDDPQPAQAQPPVKTEGPKDAAAEVPVKPSAESLDPSKPLQPVPADTPQVSAPTEPLVKEMKTIQIPYKATAESVERSLVDSGILTPDNTFVETLKKQNKLNRIRVGTYQIPVGASEADIVTIIATPPKK
ncbi:DNA polymerase III subunit gamma/tau [Brevibacillus borstelensis]|uniref:DNA polymerase III subunit gamma/tau n=1 Tax=Brevibacillus borstelensis TaxID=45462 RepID=UPI0030C20FDE